MANSRGEVIRDARGREVVQFTTTSRVRAAVATCIPHEALDKVVRPEAQARKTPGAYGGGPLDQYPTKPDTPVDAKQARSVKPLHRDDDRRVEPRAA